MKIVRIFKLQRRSTIVKLVGVAASCLIFLALKDNFSMYFNRGSKKQLFADDFPKFSTATSQLASSKGVNIDSPTTTASRDNTNPRKLRISQNSDDHSFTMKMRRRYSFIRKAQNLLPNWSRHVYYDLSTPPEEFRDWSDTTENMCNGKMIGYANEFVNVRNMIIDRTFCTCELKGGELIEDVINQDEEDEYYVFEMGCFQIACDSRLSYFFNENNHLTRWMYSVQTRDVRNSGDSHVDGFTIAITRYEYANLYHTMTDWYNAFLVMQYFNHTSYNTNILIVDAHPYGSLDSVWTQLFNSTTRLSALPKRTQFKNMVWGIVGYNSLMKIYISPTPPLIEEFRSFFLSAYNVDLDHRIECKKLSILLIWRHNYVAHPRNPSGRVSRKIHNEEQLVRYIKKQNPNFTVRGVQIDAYSMRQQLNFIANADILIGIHGAGLTHAMFLPNTSALIELVPNYWTPMSEHFKAICVWRGLRYYQWFNNQPENEFPDSSTHIPVHIMNTLIKNTVKELCGNSTTIQKHP